MTITELADKLNAKIVSAGDTDRPIEGGYAGDFLSNVIGKAPSGCAWFTVMNNVNVCAVATLADAGCIVLCEGVMPDKNMQERALAQNIGVIVTDNDVYTAVRLAGDIG